MKDIKDMNEPGKDIKEKYDSDAVGARKDFSLDEILQEAKANKAPNPENPAPKREKWWEEYLPKKPEVEKPKVEPVPEIEVAEELQEIPQTETIQDLPANDITASSDDNIHNVQDVHESEDNTDISISEIEAVQSENESSEIIQNAAISQPDLLQEKHELWIGLEQENSDDDEIDYEASSEPDLSELMKGIKAQKIRRVILSAIDDEEDLDAIEDKKPLHDQQDIIDDYNSPEDTQSVLQYIEDKMRGLWFRLILVTLGTIPLLYLNLAPKMGLFLPDILNPKTNMIPYMSINIILTLYIMIVCMSVVISGFGSFLKLRADGDSLAAIAIVAVLVQNIYLGFNISPSNSSVVLFGGLAALSLFVNTIGKLFLITRINHNFRSISLNENLKACKILEDEGLSTKLTENMFNVPSVVSTIVKTDFATNFLENSYSEDPTDRFNLFLAPIGFIFSLFAAIFCGILSKDIGNGFTVFAASCCIFSPLSNQLVVNLPLWKAMRRLRKKNAIITGYDTINEFSGTNALVVDSAQLFPMNTLTLHGIKTFGGYRIDEAIIDAASVVCASKGPLSSVFHSVIEGKIELLKKVDSLKYEEEKGLSAWVEGRRVLVGGAQLMHGFDIETPSRDYERKYARDDRNLIYVAVSGKLSAMFVVSYTANPDISLSLRKLVRQGIGILVRNQDSNIDADFIVKQFGITKKAVNILSVQMQNETENKYTEKIPSGILFTKGISGLIDALVATVKLHFTILIGTTIQTIGMVLGYFFVAFLAFKGSYSLITIKELLIFQLVWSVAILLVILGRRET